MNYKTFENIIRSQIRVLEEPAVDMLHKVTGERYPGSGTGDNQGCPPELVLGGRAGFLW